MKWWALAMSSTKHKRPAGRAYLSESGIPAVFGVEHPKHFDEALLGVDHHIDQFLLAALHVRFPNERFGSLLPCPKHFERLVPWKIATAMLALLLLGEGGCIFWLDMS